MGATTLFSKRIKEVREALNLSQTEFAKSVGTTQTTLSAYETLERTPSLDIVKAISEKYNVSIDWLLGLSDIKNIDGKPETMGDILNMLFTIGNHCDITVYKCEEVFAGYERHSRTIYGVGFDSDILNDFVKEWDKMSSLLKDGTIDDEVYSLWLEKTIKKANKYAPNDHTPEVEEIPF